MAWYKRYIVPFKSRLGTDYAVYVFETVSGTLTRLTGAPDTFTTREEDDDDVFTPIRSQSGYIRIIDSTGGTLMETLRPDNNTEKKVELWSGTWDDAGGTFTDGALQWRGFLSTDAFTQPWDNHAHVLELGVNSVLGVLSDTQMAESHFHTYHNIAYLLYNAFDSLDAAPGRVYVATQLVIPRRDMMSVLLQYQLFCDTEDEYTGPDLTTKVVGKSYGDAIIEVLSLYGLMAREHHGDIYLVQSNLGSVSTVNYWTWPQMQSLAEGIIPGTYSGDITDGGSLMSVLSFRSTENTQGYVSGAKKVVVELQLDDNEQTMTLPAVTQDTSTVYEVDFNHNRKLFAQAHPDRAGYETFTYLEYRGNTYVGTSDYDTMLSHCLLTGYTMNPYNSPSTTPLITGAFPVRWYYKKNATDTVRLADGLFFNMQYYRRTGSVTRNLCYSLRSPYAFEMEDGYLNINFNMHSMIFSDATGDRYISDDAVEHFNKELCTEIYCAVRCGNEFWGGSSTGWVTGGNAVDNQFKVSFTGTTMKGNKTADMKVDATDGYFIPISGKNADVELYFLNAAYVNLAGETTSPLSSMYRIINDIEVTFLPSYNMIESDRSVNRYSQVLTTNGFTEEIEKYLIIGTKDNNKFSCSFIKSDDNTYIETLAYSGGNLRPEAHLLGRMASQYGRVRRTYTGIVESDVCHPLTYYTHDGKTLIPIDQNHNWRDDEQEVMFIEVGA